MLREPLSLAELLHPSAFLCALRQQAARQNKCPVDTLRLACSWESSRLSYAGVTVTLQGLLLQGASYSASSGLSEVAAEDPELSPVPPLTIAYIVAEDRGPYEDKQTVQLPLYLNSSRDLLLAELCVPTACPPSTWILAGTAFVLEEQ